MKLVKEVRKYELVENIKVGEAYRMEDTLSCDSFNCIIQEVMETGIKVIKLPSMKTMEIGYNVLAKYDCKKLSLTDNTTTKETTDNVQSYSNPEYRRVYKKPNVELEPTKEEYEKSLDAYSKQIYSILNECFGDNVRVVRV